MILQQLAVFSLATLAAATGSVLLVDATSGPYFDIQSAVDVSTNGDVVLVRSGTYPRFAVVARSLAVAADTGATVQVQGAIRIRNTGAGETVVLSGLRSHGSWSSATETDGFRATDCAGSIRVQDCEFIGGDGVTCGTLPPAGSVLAGARVRNCPDVLIARSLVVGGRLPGGYWSNQPTGASGSGLEVEASRVALQEVVARGLDGSHGPSVFCPDGSSGGNGVSVRSSSELHAQSCSFEGGDGGWAYQQAGPFAYGGSGGSGLRLYPTCPSTSIARTHGVSLFAGSGGQGTCSTGCDYDGGSGAPSHAGACASIVPLTGVVPTLEFAAVARESTLLIATTTGTPGHRIWLRMSSGTGHAWVPSQNGVRLVDSGVVRWRLVAIISAAGYSSFLMDIPTLDIGEQSRVFQTQVMSQSPTGIVQLGQARSLVIVDSTF